LQTAHSPSVTTPNEVPMNAPDDAWVTTIWGKFAVPGEEIDLPDVLAELDPLDTVLDEGDE
jgi:hypothetical protein